MSDAGNKIIAGLKDAIAGDFASVTIDGVEWLRADRQPKAEGAKPVAWPPDDDTIMAALGDLQRTDRRAWRAATFTRWKDSIDVDYPAYWLRDFLQRLAPPSPEQGVDVELETTAADRQPKADGKPVAWRDSASREVRSLEITEWLEERIGTNWECSRCGYTTYHANGFECAECGEVMPLEHELAFKLHATHSDDEAAIDRQLGLWGRNITSFAPPSPEQGEERLQRLLNERDDFIVQQGLWLDFVATLSKEKNNGPSERPLSFGELLARASPRKGAGAAPAKPDGMRAAAQALVDRLEFVHADSRFQAVWILTANRGMPYDGPKYDMELAALKAALSATAEEKNDDMG